MVQVLDSRLIDKITAGPETGMGYYVVVVVLADGRRFKDAIFQDGYITEVRGYKQIPFHAGEVKDLELSRDKLL